ncbi:MAG: asparagine synthetase, partial [Nitrososphaeria archaeon]|nr:asparagine synthetase [Nitrososphaeria archaeon]
MLKPKTVDDGLLEELTKVESMGARRRLIAYRAGTVVLRSMVEELLDMGFEWVLPVMLSRTTDPLWPDPGASIETRPELEVYGVRVRTMQSMIVHKRV